MCISANFNDGMNEKYCPALCVILTGTEGEFPIGSYLEVKIRQGDMNNSHIFCWS